MSFTENLIDPWKDTHCRRRRLCGTMGEEVPKKGKAAVVVNEGPDFRVEIQEVDVPEPSTLVHPSKTTPQRQH